MNQFWMLSHTIKEKMKKVSWVYSVNAAVKAWETSRKMRELHAFYRKKTAASGLRYSEQDVIEGVRRKLRERGIQPKRGHEGRLRFFWVGAHYEQDMSGFLQGLEGLGEVVTFRNAAGKYGLEAPVPGERRLSVPDVVRRNGECLVRQVRDACREGKIDLLMGQMWASLIDGDALAEVQGMGIPVVNVSMDDKLPGHWGSFGGRRLGSVGLAKGLDLVLTTSPDTCEWYLADGCAAVYWPLASDPALFFPRAEKRFDVVFVGGKYGTRGKFVRKLCDAGIKVEAFGPGWPNGFIGAEKISEVFGEARIILGSGYVGYNNDILTLKLRDFDAPMSGALYLTNRNPDLLALFEEGKEIACYDSVEECILKIRSYLSDEAALRAIADAGLKKCRENHSWHDRILRVLNLLEIG